MSNTWYETQTLLQDEDAKPIPQIGNPQTEAFEPLQGIGGAASFIRGKFYAVGSSATTTSIPLTSSTGLALALSTAMQSRLVGATVDVLVGTTLCTAVVNAASASGTLTLDSALPSPPAPGTPILISIPDGVSNTGSSTTLPMEIASGNLPPLTSSLPVLVATIPYTAISTSALEEHYAGVLARNGRIVTVMLVSTLNEALNVAQFQTYDGEINTLIGLSGAFPGAFIDFPNNAEGLNTGATAYWATSKENTTPQYLGVGWPDLGVAISCATDPASGNVYVLVWNEL